MTPSAEQTDEPTNGFAQYIADVVINLVRFLGPDPAAIVRTESVRKARPQD